MIVAAVIASALLHAGWNALLRRHPDGRAGGVALVAVAAVAAAVVAGGAIAAAEAVPFPRWPGLAASVAAGVLEAAYFVVLGRGLAAGGLGPVYSISRGGAVVLVWPVSMLALAEPASALALLGTAVVLAGMAAAGLERRVSRAAVGWALATSVTIAGYHLTYKVALAYDALPPAVFAVGLLVALPVQALATGTSAGAAWAALRRAPRLTVGAGLLCTASFQLFLLGLQRGGAGAVLTLRNTSVVFALALSVMIGEGVRPRQIAGALLVTIGAVLVGLA